MRTFRWLAGITLAGSVLMLAQQVKPAKNAHGPIGRSSRRIKTSPRTPRERDRIAFPEATKATRSRRLRISAILRIGSRTTMARCHALCPAKGFRFAPADRVT